MALRLTDQVDLDFYYDIDIEGADEDVRRTITREVFHSFYAGAPSLGFECDGRPIGGVIFDGTSAHIVVHPDWFGRWARLLRPTLDWLFQLRPEIEVRMDRKNTRAIAFLAHCGWPQVRECETEVFFLMTAERTRRLARTDVRPVALADARGAPSRLRSTGQARRPRRDRARAGAGAPNAGRARSRCARSPTARR